MYLFFQHTERKPNIIGFGQVVLPGSLQVTCDNNHLHYHTVIYSNINKKDVCSMVVIIWLKKQSFYILLTYKYFFRQCISAYLKQSSF